MTSPKPRKGMPSPRLSEAEFRARFLAQFQDNSFDPLRNELEQIAVAAWDAYSNHRKSPRTRRAGQEFHDPSYDLSVDWLNAREAISAQKRHDDPSSPIRILLINFATMTENRSGRPWDLKLDARACSCRYRNIRISARLNGKPEAPVEAARFGKPGCLATSPAHGSWNRSGPARRYQGSSNRRPFDLPSSS